MNATTASTTTTAKRNNTFEEEGDEEKKTSVLHMYTNESRSEIEEAITCGLLI